MKDRGYSVILGNLGNTRDRFCNGYKTSHSTEDMLRQAAAIPHVAGVELVGTWDIVPESAARMKSLLADLRLACVSIIPDLFTDPVYGKGSYSSREESVRRRALDYTRGMCAAARELGCGTVNLWLGQDGYDYLLTADYERERDWELEAIRTIASEYPDLNFALEYKPKEPRTHSYLARMADTLLVAIETGCHNVGVTIDTGHAFVAGEVVGESIAMARRHGNRLFHMHFNDNHGYWDDDMIVGSVHTVAFLEMLYWLDRCDYSGWLSMDQYPYREDAAGALSESIECLVRLDEVQRSLHAEIDALLSAGDAVETSRFLRRAILSGGAGS